MFSPKISETVLELLRKPGKNWQRVHPNWDRFRRNDGLEIRQINDQEIQIKFEEKGKSKTATHKGPVFKELFTEIKRFATSFRIELAALEKEIKSSSPHPMVQRWLKMIQTTQWSERPSDGLYRFDLHNIFFLQEITVTLNGGRSTGDLSVVEEEDYPGEVFYWIEDAIFIDGASYVYEGFHETHHFNNLESLLTHFVKANASLYVNSIFPDGMGNTPIEAFFHRMGLGDCCF